MNDLLMVCHMFVCSNKFRGISGTVAVLEGLATGPEIETPPSILCSKPSLLINFREGMAAIHKSMLAIHPPVTSSFLRRRFLSARFLHFFIYFAAIVIQVGSPLESAVLEHNRERLTLSWC